MCARRVARIHTPGMTKDISSSMASSWRHSAWRGQTSTPTYMAVASRPSASTDRRAVCAGRRSKAANIRMVMMMGWMPARSSPTIG